MSSYETQCQEDARLAILGALARERDATSNSLSLARVLDTFGIRRSREWVETQLRFLDDLNAVNLRDADLPGLGKTTIATLTRVGRDHFERRILLSGVTAPADEE